MSSRSLTCTGDGCTFTLAPDGTLAIELAAGEQLRLDPAVTAVLGAFLNHSSAVPILKPVTLRVYEHDPELLMVIREAI